jgi:hypothetical protein
MYETTWLIVKDPVDSADLSRFALNLHGAVTVAEPPAELAASLPGAPAGVASLSFSTRGTARGQHEVFAEAAGKWLDARGARYAFRYPGGDWQHAGRRA